jgi:Fe-S-cluster containining protein
MDFTPYFMRYEALAAQADAVFDKVAAASPGCVKCGLECSDCCWALFDLTFIEALYLNHRFKEMIVGAEEKRAAILDKAGQVDRKLYKIKKEAYKAIEAGKNEGEVVAGLALERSRCPLLNGKERCDLYPYRPITCRLYGIPTAIGGKGHSCGLSGFEEGKPYPTVNLDVIQNKLYEISADLVKDLSSKFTKLGEILVPVSMALLNDYNDEYLGIGEKGAADDGKGGHEDG